MKNLIMKKGLSLVLLMLVAGCGSTGKATNFNGLSSADGKATAHLSTSNLAIHTMFGKTPLWGNASLDKTVDDFTMAVKAAGGSKYRIVQSKQSKWWFIYPPISFFLTPVSTNVAGEAIE